MWALLLSGFSGTDLVFAVCAVVGTVFFFLRAAWMFIGGMGDAGHDIGGHDVGGGHDLGGHAASGAAGHGAGAGHGVDAHHLSDSAFQLFSIHSINAFIMMFGWVGLACTRQLDLSFVAAVPCAFAAGTASMVLVAVLVRAAWKLVSPGQRFDITDTLGLAANVYMRIPADGKGKVQVTVGGVVRELEAVSETHEELASFQSVKIVRVVDPQTVSVAKAG